MQAPYFIELVNRHFLILIFLHRIALSSCVRPQDLPSFKPPRGMQHHFLSSYPTESSWLWHKGTTGRCGWGAMETMRDHYKQAPHLPPKAASFIPSL